MSTHFISLKPEVRIHDDISRAKFNFRKPNWEILKITVYKQDVILYGTFYANSMYTTLPHSLVNLKQGLQKLYYHLQMSSWMPTSAYNT